MSTNTPAVPVLPDVETAEPTEPAVDETPETPTEPEADALPDVDDAVAEYKELASLREFADGSFACYDAVRKAEREVESAKNVLKRAKADFDAAVDEWGSYTEQNRYPLFGDPLEQDGAASDSEATDDEWRDVEVIDLEVSDSIVSALAENPDHPITTMGELSDWCKSRKHSSDPYQDIKGIGETKAEELRKADMAFWKTRSEDAPVAEVVKPVCPNCESEEFAEDGDCVKCHEPKVVPAEVGDDSEQ